MNKAIFSLGAVIFSGLSYLAFSCVTLQRLAQQWARSASSPHSQGGHANLGSINSRNYGPTMARTFRLSLLPN
jgi:hypothetical protein